MALGCSCRNFDDSGRDNNRTGSHNLEKSGDDLSGMHWDWVKV